MATPSTPATSSTPSTSSFSLSTYNIKTLVTINLDNTNYLTWNTQISHFLHFTGLFKYVDGSLPNPEKLTDPTTSPISSAEWNCFNRSVLACINATLSESLVHQALGFDNASALWKSLEGSYQQQSTARRTILRSQLRSLKKHSFSITEYLQQIHFLSSSLAAINDPVTDADLVLLTLEGLPKTYRPFVTSIENLASPPTFTQLRAKLLTHEQRVISDDSDHVTSDAHSLYHALFSQQQVNYNSKYPSGGPNNFLSSSQPPTMPHATSYSTNNKSFTTAPKSSNNQTQSQNKYKGTCQICKKQGHSAQRCKYRYTPSNYGGQTSQFAGLHQQSTQPPLLPTPTHASWIPDSGATSHMTFDPSLIQQLHPYAGSDQVIVGDGPPHRDPSPPRQR